MWGQALAVAPEGRRKAVPLPRIIEKIPGLLEEFLEPSGIIGETPPPSREPRRQDRLAVEADAERVVFCSLAGLDLLGVDFAPAAHPHSFRIVSYAIVSHDSLLHAPKRFASVLSIAPCHGLCPFVGY